MRSLPPAKKPNKAFWVKLAVLAVLAGAGGLALLRGIDLRSWMEWGLSLVRDAGPLAFFGGMAVLPAVGFPLSPFTLTAGSVFAPTLGWGVVLAATWLALSINVMITYVIARWLARPLLEKLVLRMGYDWPQVKPADYMTVTLLVRMTPGPPFVLQSVILGLAEVPVRIYLLGSILVAGAYGTAFVFFGDALLQGKGRMALLGFMLLTALTLGAQLFRRHLARKKAGAEANA